MSGRGERSNIKARPQLLYCRGNLKFMAQLNSALAAWRAVDAEAREIGGAQLRDLSAADPGRWQNFHAEHDGWLLDFSRPTLGTINPSLEWGIRNFRLLPDSSHPKFWAAAGFFASGMTINPSVEWGIRSLWTF